MSIGLRRLSPRLPKQSTLSIHRLAPQSAGSSRLTLPYSPLIITYGDSQALPTVPASETTAAQAAYVLNPQIQVLNAAGAFETYNPAGTRSGLSAYSNNVGTVGHELTIAARIAAKYTNTVYIEKRAAPGSYQGHPAAQKVVPSAGATITGSISGNILTVTSAQDALANALIVGANVPAGTYVLFGTGTAKQWYVGKLGQTSNVNYSVASTAMTMTYVTDSYDTSEPAGGLYLGASNSITNQMRGLFSAGYTALVNAGKTPRVVCVVHLLGTNDMADATSASGFKPSALAFLTRLAADFDLSSAKIFLPRVGTAGVTTNDVVRAGQADVVAADPTRRFLINMDGQNRWDGTHWDSAGQAYLGNAAADALLPLPAA